MNNRNTPGLGQWLAVTVILASVILLLFKVYQYGQSRAYLPTGLTIANIDVGGYTIDEAAELVSNRYIDAPVILDYNSERITINPGTDAEFQLDLDSMLNDATYQQKQQDFWSGFWGYLTGSPVEMEMVPLKATHNRDTLIETLQVIASRLDQPTQPPQPVPSTLSFQYGEPGTQLNISASLRDIESALYRPTSREARLIVETVVPKRPEINLLTHLIVNHLESFTGATSVFILDLDSGEEVAYNAALPLSGMDIIKVGIAVEAYRVFDEPLGLFETQLISATLTNGDNTAVNELLAIISGQNDPVAGAKIVTNSWWQLGLANSFIAEPYDGRGNQTVNTPANSQESYPTNPDPQKQTTAEDMGALLSMIYYCARDGQGALIALYDGAISQNECQQLLAFLQRNQIGSLIEEGVPSEVPIAHRYSWIEDTHGDAGIVFSQGGDYILVEYLSQPTLAWETSSPLLADISQATYNFFNFDRPYFGP